jgi:hypothetical protein
MSLLKVEHADWMTKHFFSGQEKYLYILPN